MNIVRTGVRSVWIRSWTFLGVKLQRFGSERDIYIYMYIRFAFFIEIRLRVSRSLRSLANYPFRYQIVVAVNKISLENSLIFSC